MKKVIILSIVFFALSVFAACGQSKPVTLGRMRSAIEDTGEYHIFEHYIPSDQDYPLDRDTVGGFSFYANALDGAISQSTSVMVMEFRDESSANDYAKYLRRNRDSWISIVNGKYLIAAVNQSGAVGSDELYFLDKLIIGEAIQEKPASPSSEGYIAMFCLLGFGALFALIGFFGVRKTRQLRLHCTSRTEGVVVENHRHRTGGKSSSTTYCPEFSFMVDGVAYGGRSAVGTQRPRFAKGQEVTVLYDPYRPDDYYVEEDGLSSAVYFIFLVAGIAVFISAFFMPSLYGNP